MAFLSTPPIFSNSISSLFKCKRMPSAFRHSSILAKRSSKPHTALSLSHFFSSSHIVSRFPNRRTHLSENIQAASFLNEQKCGFILDFCAGGVRKLRYRLDPNRKRRRNGRNRSTLSWHLNMDRLFTEPFSFANSVMRIWNFGWPWKSTNI